MKKWQLLEKCRKIFIITDDKSQFFAFIEIREDFAEI